MELYERANELQNIVDTLDTLIDDIQDKEYKEILAEIKYQAQDELEQVEDELYEIEEQEEKELEREYDNQRI